MLSHGLKAPHLRQLEYEQGDQRFGDRRGKRTALVVKDVQEGGPSVEMHKLGAGRNNFESPTALGSAVGGGGV